MKKTTAATTEKPDLRSLAAKIRAEHGKATASAINALEHAVKAGRLLIEAKGAVDHGKWLPWLKANCPEISDRTVQAYMQVAKHAPKLLEDKSAAAAHLTLSAALKKLTKSGKAADVVKRRADVEHQARRAAFGAQELAQSIGDFLSEGSHQGQKLRALIHVADHVSLPDWLGLRYAFDRLIEAALAQRAEVVEALRREALLYDETEFSEVIRDEGPLRFIGRLNDYVALADAVDGPSASPVMPTPTPAPAR